jgi:ribosomal protein S18 acetylase RimI-like enzyme
MNVDIKVLSRDDTQILNNIAPSLFDKAIDPALCNEFLNDPRHHIVVAIEKDVVIGFVSAVHYIHPDKPAELWINEVAIAPGYRERGIAKDILHSMFRVGAELGCKEAWVLTDRSNIAAMKTYSSVGGEEYEKEMTMFTFYLDK